AKKTESINEPVSDEASLADAIVTDAAKGAEPIQSPASEHGVVDEQQELVALLAHTGRVIEITEQSTRKESKQADHQNPTGIADDGDAQVPGIERIVSDEAASGPQGDTPANAQADSEGTEDTGKLTNDEWSSIADKTPLAIPTDSEVAAKTPQEPE